MDYVRVLYKRRWVAIPAFSDRRSRRRDQQLPHDADLRGAHAAADREGHAEGRRRSSTMFQSSDGWYNDDYYQTQYRILQSRSLARKTAELTH